MRIGYSEDEDYPGQFELWQANCHRSLHGKKGQAVLRELEAALLALPEKRLLDQEIASSETGEVCAVGALLTARRCARGMTREAAIEDVRRAGYNGRTDAVAAKEGVPPLVAWKLVELNDIELEACDRITPERRYEKVLEWVKARIHA